MDRDPTCQGGGFDRSWGSIGVRAGFTASRWSADEGKRNPLAAKAAEALTAAEERQSAAMEAYRQAIAVKDLSELVQLLGSRSRKMRNHRLVSRFLPTSQQVWT